MAPRSDEPALFGDAPPPSAAATPYRVLARKYRPQSFDQLIGQDAMVQTLANAIKRDRIAHAFLLTGVRGVGKTSTARLVAKALNCVGPDGEGGPTIAPCGVCEPCRAIAEGRHIDVVEMDAASHTGVDDIREIVEAVRYAAVSARFKVYVIDEVHMLSKNAFNALLKTLEEPPQHVKFLFATTELSKVPVTVLSRCQRFDLRRIPADKLAAHFAEVARLEEIEADPEAIALIARAAEGSARDGLSILDQAFAHGQGRVDAAAVREMLGLADRGLVRGLLALLLAGDAPGALAAIRDQYELGVEPAALLRDLPTAVHGITRAKAGGGADPAQSAEEREAYADWASRLGYATVHRLWQLLLKGLAEVVAAPIPLEAAEMALLRVIHAGELPDPSAMLAKIGNGGRSPIPRPPRRGYRRLRPLSPLWSQLLASNGKAHLAQQLNDLVELVRYAPPELVVRPLKPFPGEFARDASAALEAIMGTAWRVTTSDQPGEPSLLAREQGEEARVRAAILETPLVKAAFKTFPDAELLSYTSSEQQKA